MKKRRNVGKRISIFTIILALFVAIMFAILIVHWFGNSGDKQEAEIKTLGKTDKEKYEEVFYDNGWDKSIVAEIKEDVPIPTGFKYVSGEKETGFIIEDKKTAQKMMWIPYDENVVLENIDEYYANVKYDTIDLKSYKNMTKYGGFYVLLSEISEYGLLKDLNQETYDSAKQKSEELYAESEVINSHLVYKTELEQILAFANKNGINLEQTANKPKEVTVDKLIQTNTSNINKVANENLKLSLVVADIETDSSVGKVNGFSNKNWYIYDVPVIITTPSGKELTVPIPVGYDVEVSNNVVTITSQGKNNLSYVWIPVNEEFNTTDFSEEGIKKLNANLKQAYGIADRTQEEVLDYTKDPTDTVEYKMLQKSVEQYGGFYMGQAELGFDNETQFNNQVRGLSYIVDEKTGKKESYAKNGDYYRSVTSKIVEANTNQNSANYANSALEKNADGSYTLTYEKAKELTEKANEKNVTAAGNLIYGAQWNAAILWIINSGNGYMLEQLVQNSESLPGAKYENTTWEKETESLKDINGLYGIAGNLSDLTQEKYSESNNTNVTIDPVTNTNIANEEYYIGRGGNYGTTGQEKTASGYQIINDETVQNDAYGIRDCLILSVGAYDKEIMEHRDKTLVSSLPNETGIIKTEINTWYSDIWEDYDGGHGGQLAGNGKAVLIADLIHTWLVRQRVTYATWDLKLVPGTDGIWRRN